MLCVFRAICYTLTDDKFNNFETFYAALASNPNLPIHCSCIMSISCTMTTNASAVWFSVISLKSILSRQNTSKFADGKTHCSHQQRLVIVNSGPFHWHGFPVMPAWESYYIHHKMWNEKLFPFLNFPLLFPSQWRLIKHDDVSNHQSHNCLLNCLLRHRSK